MIGNSLLLFGQTLFFSVDSLADNAAPIKIEIKSDEYTTFCTVIFVWAVSIQQENP